MLNPSGLTRILLEERSNTVTVFFADGTSEKKVCTSLKEAKGLYSSYASKRENWAHNRGSDVVY